MSSLMNKLFLPILSCLLIILISSCHSAEYERIAAEQAHIIDSIEKTQKVIMLEAALEVNNVTTSDVDTSRIGIIPIRPVEIYYLKRGYPICWSREDIKKMVTYISLKDYDAIDSLLFSYKCQSAWGGEEFCVEEKVGALTSIVKIYEGASPYGKPAWTVREALKKK